MRAPAGHLGDRRDARRENGRPDGQRLDLDPTDFIRRLSDGSWEPEPISPQLFGRTSVTVLRLAGTLDIPGEGLVQGPWRYAETRTRSDSATESKPATRAEPDVGLR